MYTISYWKLMGYGSSNVNSTVDTPGVNYKNVINEINDFWMSFEGQPYYDSEEEEYQGWSIH
jgi:hypothetical protein